VRGCSGPWTSGGRVTTTGLGGFTTGGGYGWTSSKYGLACDNRVSAEVVLADGRVVRASEHEHADLVRVSRPHIVRRDLTPSG
jgi:FAD/FMN-containing dehydrogenase